MKNIIIFILKLFSTIAAKTLLIFPHKKDYFIFNSKYGFSDNSKYLFLHYLKMKKQCVWVFSDKNCHSELLSLIANNPNAKLVKRNSISLIYYLTRAKFIFVTHSFLDLGVTAIKSCPVINLWHGIPIKKMGYDSESDIKLFSLNDINPYLENDYVISSSELTKRFSASCMKLPLSKILPLGQPRNDFLQEHKLNFDLINSLRSSYTLDSQAKLFLYAPTFRDKVHTSKELYMKLIHSFSSKASNKDILILRLHPKEKQLLDKSVLPSNVKISVIKDVQEELLISDALISDYSSIIFDFSILDKPIFLYSPDRNKYFCNRGGSYFEYDFIIKECQLIEAGCIDSLWSKQLEPITHQELKALHNHSASQLIYNRFN